MAYNIPKKYIWEMIDFYASKIVEPGYKGPWIKPSFDQWLSFRDHFSYAVPNRKSIEEIAKFAGNDTILEIGSGKGLHAYLLSLEGVKVIPTDSLAWNQYGYPFMKVENLDYKDALNKYKTGALMIVWPEIGDLAYQALRLFKGNKLIFIGEVVDPEKGIGLVADEDFFKLLESEWKPVLKVRVPQFVGFDDWMYLYERK